MSGRLVAALIAVLYSVSPVAAAELRHDASASSAADIAVSSEGVVTMHSRNATLVPYAIFDGTRHLPRLATVTADVTRRTDAEGDDPSSKVSVTVDDLSDASQKRLASFSDPGSEWGACWASPTSTSSSRAAALGRPSTRSVSLRPPSFFQCHGRQRGRLVRLGDRAQCRAAHDPLGGIRQAN